MPSKSANTKNESQNPPRVYSAPAFSSKGFFVRPSDILCLRNMTSLGREFGQIWAHDPLDPNGWRTSDGKTTYTSPALGGKMAPHNFALFQHVCLRFRVDLELLSIIEPRDYGSYRNMDEDFVSVATMTIHKTGIVDDFVKILSNSPVLKFVKVHIKVGFGKHHLHVVPRTDAFISISGLEPLKRLTNVQRFEIDVGDSDPVLHRQELSPNFRQMLLDLE
ncbi:hypothetical protein B0J14DRAFT_74904 [Halenospora varia]|nr:hypothetical protein B0J14DRAFT_74904 [Halenospora varia]